MSAIDFHAEVDKVNENGADRVKLTLNGQSPPSPRLFLSNH